MPEEDLKLEVVERARAIWDGTKYSIALTDGVNLFRPFAQAGEVRLNGKLQDKPFQTSPGDQVEYKPFSQPGILTWEMQVRFRGLSVVAKVRHEQAGHYVISKELPAMREIDLAEVAIWESIPDVGDIWDETRIKTDLAHLKVVHGCRLEIWSEIIAVQGVGEVIIAVATPAVPAKHAELENFVGITQVPLETDNKSMDFFASKVQLVTQGAILARKILGQPGVPGKDVFGKVFPVAPFKDFQFRLKKNVCLSEDGLEVLAACAGQPIRLDEKTYMVENVYILNNNVDMRTGSIEFPGDVYVNGNVQDGLRIFAGGRLEIQGSVSHAEIRAEKGAKIYKNLLGGKTVIGEKFVVHSELLRSVSELLYQLSGCVRHTTELIRSPKAINFNEGQCLKMVLEKHFPELPKLSNRVLTLVADHKKDEMVTEGLLVSIQTAKHLLTGLGPLKPESLRLLQRVNQALEQFVENIVLEIPEKLSFAVQYVQGATIECGGDFECEKGAYNSNIRVEGDVTIKGVCRGGKIIAGGNVSIRELGGSEVSSTFIQIRPESSLLVDYCHPNAIIAVGKEIIYIEEVCKKLDIYWDNGRVQVKKVRDNPL